MAHIIPLLCVIVTLMLLAAPTPEGARILLYPFSHCKNSHLLNMEKLAGVLLEGGHEVTMLVSTSYEAPYSDTALDGLQYIHFKKPDNVQLMCSFETLQQYLDTPMSQLIRAFYSSTFMYCEQLVQQRHVLDDIKAANFDLAVYDAVDQCSKILADYIDIPFIAFYTHGMDSLFPRNPAYMPSMVTSFSDEMSLHQRVLNTLGYAVQQVIVFTTLRMYQNLRTQYHINESLDLHDTFNRASLKFVLGDYGLDYAGPVQPSTVLVGGVIQSTPRPIPPHIQDFLDGADHHGVVLVSFGSLVKYYDPYWREIFAEALARLPQRVLWKYDGALPTALGANTLTSPWLPQADILKHPNVKVFVTHCGWNSAYESSVSGVPVVAIPLFADQFFQSTKLTQRAKMGVKLDIRTLTANTLREAILDVGSNPEFQHNAKQVSAIVQMKPLSQKDEILYWTNFVVQLKGARHLRSPGTELRWYQYLLLDVLTVIVLACILTFLLLKVIFNSIYKVTKLFASKVTKLFVPKVKGKVKGKVVHTKTVTKCMDYLNPSTCMPNKSNGIIT